MTQDVRRTPPWAKQESASDPGAPQEESARGDAVAPPDTSEATVGTGTAIALGCIGGTVLLILIGLLFVAIAAIF